MMIASDQIVTGMAAAKAKAGNAKKLAEMMGLSGGLISRWGDTVPLNWLLKMEQVTGVPRYVLRPDLFTISAPPAPPAKSKKRKAA